MKPLYPHPGSWKETPPDLNGLQTWELESLEGARRQGFRSVLLQASVGTGKTVLAAKSAKAMERTGRRMVFLAHLKTLINQAERTFRDWGVDVQVEQGLRKARHFFGRPTHVIASKDSLNPARLEDFLRRTRLHLTDVEVWIDECHLATTSSFLEPTRRLEPVFTVGLTGTPMRLDGKSLVGEGSPFETLVCRYDFLTACRHGNLVSPTLLECEGSIDLRGIKITRQPAGVDYDPVALSARISEQLGHVCKAAAEQIRLRGIRRTLGFFTDIGVARAAESLFLGLGFRCRSLYGTLPDSDDVLSSYHDGQYDIMTSCQMIDVGFDDRPTDGILMAAPTKSAVRVLQRAGRGARLYPDKPTYYIIGYSWMTDDDGPQSTLDLLLKGVADPGVRQRAGNLLRQRQDRNFLEVVEQAEIEERKEKQEQARLRHELPVFLTERAADYGLHVYDPLNLTGDSLSKEVIKKLKKCGIAPKEIGSMTPEAAESFLKEWYERSVYLGMASCMQVRALCRGGWKKEAAWELTWSQARDIIFAGRKQNNRYRKAK